MRSIWFALSFVACAGSRRIMVQVDTQSRTGSRNQISQDRSLGAHSTEQQRFSDRLARFIALDSLAMFLFAPIYPVYTRQMRRRSRDAANGIWVQNMKHLLAPVMVDASSDQDAMITPKDLKQKLRKLISRTNGGKKATVEERLAIEALIAKLERMNPTQDPAISPLVSGKWVLLFTGASETATAERKAKEGVVGSAVTELTGSASVAASDDKPMPLGRWLTTLSSRIIDNRGNFQDIDADNARVVNRAELALLGVPISLSIEGRCALVPRNATGGEAKRLQVNFERVTLQRKKATVLQIPLTWASNGEGPSGFVDTTYLDEDMRLGRGDKGSFFVTLRIKR